MRQAVDNLSFADAPPASEGAVRLTWFVAGAVATALLLADWLPGLAVLVLGLGWRYLPYGEGPPVIQLAFSFQWLQVTCGLFYTGLTGRELRVTHEANCDAMMLLGLGSIIAMFGGFALGDRLSLPSRRSPERDARRALSPRQLVTLYVASVAVTGIVQELAWLIPGLTQGILMLSLCRFLLLFLVLRLVIRPTVRWGWFLTILIGEVALGFTGYFAGFRESLIIATLVQIEAFDRRRFQHWCIMVLLGSLLLLTGLVWTGVKGDYRSAFEYDSLTATRSQRLQLISSLAAEWAGRGREEVLVSVDQMVDRLWAIYYPALAISRVPEELPYKGGELLWGAVKHVLMPRLFFPEKDVLASDSELVRDYSGIWVASSDEGTSIAFGYAAESYIDFGLPLMFVPILAFGLMMGLAHRFFLRALRHRELAIALTAVLFWTSLYLFEQSWAKMLGLAITRIVFLGGATFLIDRLLLFWRSPAPPDPSADA